MLNESPTKSLLYVTTFLALAPIALATSIFALLTLSHSKPKTINVLAAQTQKSIFIEPKTGVQVYASLPNNLPILSSNFEIGDARYEIIKKYLSYHNSPLTPYSNYLIEIADKYNLDFRLLVAIAQKESNLCKKIPTNSFNCWGWGIHSKGTLRFDSYEESIEKVAKGIRENYIDKGYVTVDEIMDKWVPHSPNRAWAKGVNQFMKEME